MCFIKAPKVSQQATNATAAAPPIIPAPIETADSVKEAGQDTRKIRRKRSGRDSLRIKRAGQTAVNVPSTSSGVNV